MEPYRIVVKQSVAKDLKKIPKKEVERILSAIQSLATTPRPAQSKKLSYFRKILSLKSKNH
jgi:mRNA interferase RelE/StbE